MLPFAARPCCRQYRLVLQTSLLFMMGNLPFATAQTPPRIQFDTLTKRVNAILKQEKTPGVQVLVFTKDSLLYKHNAGVMDLKTKTAGDRLYGRLGAGWPTYLGLTAN